MNSKLWIRKAISSCLMIAMLATYSMVALAGTDKASGELIVTGKNINGDAPFALVNGETARSGRTIFTSSSISTPDNTTAVINLGNAGEIELAPNTSLNVSFDAKTASFDLTSGSLTVLKSAQAVNVNAGGKSLALNAGETANAETGKAFDDDYRDSSGKCVDADKDGKEECNNGASWYLWALVFGGAVGGIVIAATQGNNDIQLGGNSTVTSPTR